VYIIDEAHMLSTGAFNALLKIMEEPPAHVLFILATTEIHKVPATIMSRCQRFDFRRIPGDIIAGHLMHIARKENVSLDPAAALMIARLSDGGMRDAISLFDLCLSGGDEVTADTVRECAGLADKSYLFDIQSAVIEGDAPAALEILASLWEKAIDYQRLCDQLLDSYRNLMIVKSAHNPAELIACLPDELERYRGLAAKYPMERIFYSLSILEDTQARMSRTAQRRGELEMGLLKLCDPSLGHTPQALLARIEKLEKMHVGAAIGRPSETADSSDAQCAPPQTEPVVIVEPGIPAEEFAGWEEVLQVIKKKNRALYGTLANSKAYTAEGDLLLVDAGDSLFTQMVRSDDYAKKSLRDAALEATGKKYRLGPYQAEKYEIKTAAKLDQILEQAQELGLDMEIRE
jgi:DNA polymerase-3 subunit gamma/tau